MFSKTTSLGGDCIEIDRLWTRRINTDEELPGRSKNQYSVVSQKLGSDRKTHRFHGV